MRTEATPAIPPTDGELLMRFTEHRDQEAFRHLVERHRGLVVSVCRRVLWNEQDVEDASQATFLVLARSARAIRRRDSVASWLFKVAHRAASRAACQRARQAAQPLAEEPESPSQALAQVQQREMFEILSEELQRLPDCYRVALILTYLEGKSQQAAAQELDCTDGVLKGRLARGRRMLRQRLMRRGVSLSVAMGAGSSASLAAGELSVGSEAMASEAIQFVTAGESGGACSPASVSLAEGVLAMQSIGLSKSMVAAALIAMAGVFAAAGIGLGIGRADGESRPVISRASEFEDVGAADAGDPLLEVSSVTASPLADGGGAPSWPSSTKATSPPVTASPLADGGGAQPARGGGGSERAERLPVDLRRASASEERIQRALADRAVDLEFVDTPLRDALEFIRDAHEIPILIEVRELEEELISTEEPISLSLSDVALESALRILLGPLDLEYLIEDDVMKITTRLAAEDRRETRVYPIQHLLDAGFETEALVRIVQPTLPHFPGPQRPPGEAMMGMPGMGGMAGPPFRPAPPGDSPGARRAAEARVESVGDFLVITQSQPAHRRTAELMDQLGRAAAMAK